LSRGAFNHQPSASALAGALGDDPVAKKVEVLRAGILAFHLLSVSPSLVITSFVHAVVWAARPRLRDEAVGIADTMGAQRIARFCANA
jgi:hypothetical protein